MSLISPQNFLAPFTNKTHLITIILAAILFAAFRLSGGGVSSVARHHGSDASLTDPEVVIPDDQFAPEDSPRQAEAPTEDDLLDQMVGKEGHDSQKENNTGLDDIERRLGLR